MCHFAEKEPQQILYNVSILTIDEQRKKKNQQQPVNIAFKLKEALEYNTLLAQLLNIIDQKLNLSTILANNYVFSYTIPCKGKDLPLATAADYEMLQSLLLTSDSPIIAIHIKEKIQVLIFSQYLWSFFYSITGRW